LGLVSRHLCPEELMSLLKWDYCECGCKCFVVEGTDLHMFDDLNGKYTLFEGRERVNSVDHTSFKDADKDAHGRVQARIKQLRRSHRTQ
jgi:hypothetical protein